MRVLLINTYDLGHQPFGLASPAAWLREAGIDVECADLTRAPLSEPLVRRANGVAFYLPMHTATRLALPIISEIRRLNPSVDVCAYGLYASLNRRALGDAGVATVLGAEFEADLVRWAGTITAEGPRHKGEGGTIKAEGPRPKAEGDVPRLAFRVPDRRFLPPLTRYAWLEMPDGTRRTAGYTEASRGCKHECRHCPIVPVYQGRFRIVPLEVVLADIRTQVEMGARHITFGDPDFFNGVGHARRLALAMAREFPGVTYDVTIKIEHLLRHAADLPVLARTGCLFVTSAVESIEDEVLSKLDKGHTRQDFERAVSLCREAGLVLSPTFIPFTPWTTRRGYCELLSALASLGLVEQVAPVQLAIRLLIPDGSRVLELPDVRAVTGAFDPAGLVFPWRHPDPQVDALHASVQALVAARPDAPRGDTFGRIWKLAHDAAALAAPPLRYVSSPAGVPHLSEPWYC